LQGNVILLDAGDNSFVVTDIASFADVLKTTMSSLPASGTQNSNIISTLASCRLVCNVHSISKDEVQYIWVACLPTEPPVKWVCRPCVRRLSLADVIYGRPME